MLYSAGEPETLRGSQHSHACRPSAKRNLRQRGPRVVYALLHCTIEGEAAVPFAMPYHGKNTDGRHRHRRRPGRTRLATERRAAPREGCARPVGGSRALFIRNAFFELTKKQWNHHLVRPLTPRLAQQFL
jgi:hypothetical protein